MKHFKLIPLAFLLILLVGCGGSAETNDISNEKIKVAVGIVPEAQFIEKIAGDLVDVVVMIPPGYSPSNYQPTPKEMIDFSDSQIYFAMGVNAEINNIIPKIPDINKDMKVVMLREEIEQIYPLIHLDEMDDPLDNHHDSDSNHDDHGDHDVHDDHDEHDEYDEHDEHDHGDVDPHIWLSPMIASEIVNIMVNELSLADPENKDIYKENGSKYIDELNTLDSNLKNIFSNHDNLKIIMYHPAYGYFARDYGIEIVTIEENGKDATIKRLKEVIDLAKAEGIKHIFYQEEFDNSQAKTIAEEIGGEVIKVSPLSKTYIESLLDVGEKFRIK